MVQIRGDFPALFCAEQHRRQAETDGAADKRKLFRNQEKPFADAMGLQCGIIRAYINTLGKKPCKNQPQSKHTGRRGDR